MEEEIKKEELPKKKNNKLLIIILIVVAVLAVGLATYEVIYFYPKIMDNGKNKDTGLIDEQVEIITDQSGSKKNYYSIIENNEDYIVSYSLDGECDVHNKKTGEIYVEDCDDVVTFYDGYYVVALNRKLTLKRYNKIVVKNLDLTDFKLYKDSGDSKSEYIGFSYSYDGFSNLFDDADSTIFAELNEIYGDLVAVHKYRTEEGYKIYNRKTGKIIMQGENYIYPFYADSPYYTDSRIENEIKYLILTNSDEEKILSVEKEKVVLKDYSVLKKSLSCNEKYFSISNENGVGIADYNEKIIIEPQYDSINLKSNNQRFFAVSEDGFYGLIDTNNKIQLDFMYDAIEVYEDIIVTVKDLKLSIYNMDLKKIGKDYQLAETEEKYRDHLCCGGINNFGVNYENGIYMISTSYSVLGDNVYEGVQIVVTPEGKIIDNAVDVDTASSLKGKTYILGRESNKFILYDEHLTKLTTLSPKINYERIISVSLSIIGNNYGKIDIRSSYKKEEGTYYLELSTGKLVEEENIREYESLGNNYFYNTEYDVINIYNKNERLIKKIVGKDIEYLGDNYYAIQNKDDKWYILEIKF